MNCSTESEAPAIGLLSLDCPKALVDSEQISQARLARRVGGVEPVVVDAVESGTAIARGYGDAPEIDGNVLVTGATDVEPGDFIDVRMINHDSHDLMAELVN